MVLACLAHLLVFGAAVLLTWSLAGRAVGISLLAGLTLLGFVNKSMEYPAYKQQSPLLGAAVVWICVMAVLTALALAAAVGYTLLGCARCLFGFVGAAVCLLLFQFTRCCCQGGSSRLSNSRMWCWQIFLKQRRWMYTVWCLPEGGVVAPAAVAPG
jgi:hypothetical protein